MRLAPLVTLWILASFSFGAPAPGRSPNIVFILADDLGWGELGCYGSTFNETPHLDQLAREGVRMTQAYAAAPVCSPYRASLLTGQYPARHGLLDYLRPTTANPLSPRHVTIAERLKAAGYVTGMIGKWHLSGYRYHKAPIELRATDHGFDEELVTEIKGVGNGANFFPYIFRTQPISWNSAGKDKLLPGKEYLVDRMNHEAVRFIERHREKPFFLYLSHFAPHSILNGRPDLVEKYRRKHPPGKSTSSRCHLCQDTGLEGDPLNHWAGDHNPHLAAMIEGIDQGVGMIVKKLEELRLSKDTLIIFTSDNGGELKVTSNAPLRGGKSQLFEGGIRVPLIVKWPGKVPGDKVCNSPTCNVDFYPTFLEVSAVKRDESQILDGRSVLELFQRPGAKRKGRTLYWHYPLPKPHFLGGVSAGAIREGKWKLIEWFGKKEMSLFDLDRDPGEERDLAAIHPEMAERLQNKLSLWRNSIPPTK